jgi:hypothetical protein
MPYFAVQYDVVDRFIERRAPFREEHLALVRAAYARGELVMAGAVGEPPQGALLVFRVASALEAEHFVLHDPYVVNGLVTRWLIRPWHVVVEPVTAGAPRV